MGRIHQICDILALAECYMHARRIAPSTLSHRAIRSGTWLERCATGNVTMRSAIAFVQWLSNHWPVGLEWPAGIERPAPERGSPAQAYLAPLARIGNGASSAEATRPHRQAAAPRGNGRGAHLSEESIRTAATRLGPSGRIASPGALCRAVGVRRSVYYAVVRRYRDEIGAGRWPRTGSASERMLIALSAAGDARFASRRASAAAPRARRAQGISAAASGHPA